MNKTARFVLKTVAAGLALAAFICLLIGCWSDLAIGVEKLKSRLCPRCKSEYDDYADEELYG